MAAPIAGFQSPGQPQARAAALRAAQSGRLQRTLLVHGPAGAGKGAFTNDLLALLFCQAEDPTLRPCNACRGCRDARARTHPDLVVGGPDQWREERATGESIVAVARRWLLASAGSPILADQRVILIEGADRANEQAQNALLKALEEPLPRQMFVLVADEPGRLLPTIRSRAQPLRVGPVPKAELRRLAGQGPGAGHRIERSCWRGWPAGSPGAPSNMRADPTCSSGARQRSASCWGSSPAGRRSGSTRSATCWTRPPGWEGRQWRRWSRWTTRPHAWPARRSAPPRCR